MARCDRANPDSRNFGLGSRDMGYAGRSALREAIARATRLPEAQALARQIAGFPQACMRADRASALAQWDLPMDVALQREGAGGFAALQAEGLAGAARFAAGAGRHGQPADAGR